MVPSSFFALISRMKYIGRWGLMRNAIPENVQEHSHEVAVFAHALGVIRKELFTYEHIQLFRPDQPHEIHRPMGADEKRHSGKRAGAQP